MNDQRKQPTHFVQVARLRIETTIIEIDVDDDADDAGVEREAIETAMSLAEANWICMPFDRSAYEPFVQSIISREEIAEIPEIAEIGSKANVETLVDANEDTRYLLLMADCATGETKVVLQPWLNVDAPNLLTSDLCKAWLMALEDLGLTHMSDRLDDLAAGAQRMPSDQILFGPKVPRKPGK
jgi:hypothetical protein